MNDVSGNCICEIPILNHYGFGTYRCQKCRLSYWRKEDDFKSRKTNDGFDVEIKWFNIPELREKMELERKKLVLKDGVYIFPNVFPNEVENQ